MRCLSWRRSQGTGSGPRYSRPFAQLPGAPDVRHAAGHAERHLDSIDETGGRQFDRRRFDRHRRVYGIADALGEIHPHRASRLAEIGAPLPAPALLRPLAIVSVCDAPSEPPCVSMRLPRFTWIRILTHGGSDGA